MSVACVPAIILGICSDRLELGHRQALQSGARPPAAWWCSIFGLYGLFFLLLGLLLFVPLHKRLSRPVLVSSIANLTMSWVLVSLCFVAGDPFAAPVLAQIGLGWLSWFFLAGGVTWFLVFFYLFGSAVDAASGR